MNKITLCVAVLALCFSISLADASQQALLRVQWQQLSLQSHNLSDQDKLNRVQDLSLLVDVHQSQTTQLSRSTEQVFEYGVASEAELALTKWLMLVNLGVSGDDFRLVYVQDNETQKSSVWLAQYDEHKMTLLTSSNLLVNANTELLLAQNRVISVLNPNTIMAARVDSRRSTDNSQQTFYL